MRHLLLFGLLVCAAGLVHANPSDPLRGAWQSDRERTLEAFRKAPGMTAEQLEAISGPDFFGQMVHVYRDGRCVSVFDGECSVTPYEVVGQTEAYVDARYRDENGPIHTRRIHLEPKTQSFWLRAGPAVEYFRRVELDEVQKRHPCLKELLAGS